MPAIIQDRTNHFLRRPPRPHPYAGVRHDAQGQYYDFKTRPDLIETVLEDFAPHDAYPGVRQFYILLRHINRPCGPFETTDCGLSQGHHASTNFPEKVGWVFGRLMIMWRQVERNCELKTVGRLRKQLQRELRHFGRSYNYIGFVVGPFPTLFRTVGRKGFQIDIEFAMWGDTFDEAMQRFSDVVSVLDKSIRTCEQTCSSSF